MKIIDKIKKKIIPAKFDMSGWKNAKFLNYKTLEKIIETLEGTVDKKGSESTEVKKDNSEFYKSYGSPIAKALEKFIEYMKNKPITAHTTITYADTIKEILKLCEKYLSAQHNPLYSANRIKGIKKFRDLCKESLKHIKADKIKGWETPDETQALLRKEWVKQ